jgi:hypothetical protein
MSTESLQTGAPPPPQPTGPIKRAYRSDDEIDQALRETHGDIPAAAATLGMSYHGVYHRIRKKPRLLVRSGSPKVKKALVAKIPKDLSTPEELRAFVKYGWNGLARSLRQRRLMEQARTGDGAAFLPALALCRCGALTAHRLIHEQVHWISGELRSLEAMAWAGRGDFGREKRLRKQQMKLFDLLIEFGERVHAGAKRRFEEEFGGDAATSA